MKISSVTKRLIGRWSGHAKLEVVWYCSLSPIMSHRHVLHEVLHLPHLLLSRERQRKTTTFRCCCCFWIVCSVCPSHPGRKKKKTNKMREKDGMISTRLECSLFPNDFLYLSVAGISCCRAVQVRVLKRVRLFLPLTRYESCNLHFLQMLQAQSMRESAPLGNVYLNRHLPP